MALNSITVAIKSI